MPRFSASLLAILFGVTLAIFAVLLPLIPEPYRLYNCAAFGAIGLFLGGRVNFFISSLVTLGAKLVSDVVNFAAHDFHDDYLPMASVILGLLVYPFCGFLLVRRSENPLRISLAAILASAGFFLITNFASWLGQALPYPYTAAGLLECYKQGLPFYRGTFLGDLGFTAGLYLAFALLIRAMPVANAQPVTVENER